MSDLVASIEAAGGQGVALFVVGLVAGVVNVLAGGGGLLAMPALVLFAGLGDTTANGTFRIAVMAQSIAAVWQFRRAGRSDLGTSLRLSLPVAVGAGLGAWQAATLGDGGTRKLIIGATLLATVLLVVGEQRLTPAIAPTQRRAMDLRLAAGLVAAGWYGGLIQAGVGFTLLLVLRGLGGFDLARANVLKVELVLWYTPLAIWQFAGASHLEFAAGASLAVGMAIGAWFGATLSVGPLAAARIRVATAVMVVVAALRLALLQVGWWVAAVGVGVWLSLPSPAVAQTASQVRVLASIEPSASLSEADAQALTARAQTTIERCAAGRDVVLWLTVERDPAERSSRPRAGRPPGLLATSRLQVDGATFGQRTVRGSTPTALVDAAALLTCIALERLPPAPPRMPSAGPGPSVGRRPATVAPDGPRAAVDAPPAATEVALPSPATAPDDAQPAARSWGLVADLAAEAAALPATSGRGRLSVWAAWPVSGWRRGPRARFAWRGALGWEVATSAAAPLATRSVVASRWGVCATVGAVAGPVSVDLGPTIGRVSLTHDGLPGPRGLWFAADAALQVRLWRWSDGEVALQTSVGRMIAPLEVRFDDGGVLWRSRPWHGSVGLALRWRVGVGVGRRLAATTPGARTGRDGMPRLGANSWRDMLARPAAAAPTAALPTDLARNDVR